MKILAPELGAASNPESRHVAERYQNNKSSSSELESALSAESYRELFDTLARWNTYLEDHVPYFQKQPQEPSL